MSEPQASPDRRRPRPDDEPRPADPRDEGVEEREPEPMQVEAAHVLASEAKDRLRSRGFEEDQILSWAEAYISEEGSGDVQHFLRWIADREEESDRRGAG